MFFFEWSKQNIISSGGSIKVELMSPLVESSCFTTNISLCYLSHFDSLLWINLRGVSCTLWSAEQAPAGPAWPRSTKWGHQEGEEATSEPDASGRQSSLSLIKPRTGFKMHSINLTYTTREIIPIVCFNVEKCWLCYTLRPPVHSIKTFWWNFKLTTDLLHRRLFEKHQWKSPCNAPPPRFILYSWHAARQIYTSEPQGLGWIR